MLKRAIGRYEERFGGKPVAAAVAPGRVEVLGNHTDYNGGYVMSAAIDRVTAIAGSPILSGEIRLYAANFDREAWVGGGDIVADPKNDWASYVLGVTDQLRKADVAVAGFQAVIDSDVPVGSGLSSSAALEVSTALFLQQIFPFDMDKMEIAKLCQRAENQFVGVSSGLMDQFSSVFGRENSLLFLDCLTYEHETISLTELSVKLRASQLDKAPPQEALSSANRSDVELVICNSMTRHELTGGDYNTRRAECMAAAAYFGKKLLRDVTIEEFEARKGELPENQRKRAEHVLNENRRVLEGRKAASQGDLWKLGGLMAQSHSSSRLLFENSTPELDFLVDTALELPGCYGARLTGGGWGGATINLVGAGYTEQFRQELARRYRRMSGIEPEVFATRIGDGAHTIPV